MFPRCKQWPYPIAVLCFSHGPRHSPCGHHGLPMQMLLSDSQTTPSDAHHGNEGQRKFSPLLASRIHTAQGHLVSGLLQLVLSELPQYPWPGVRLLWVLLLTDLGLHAGAVQPLMLCNLLGGAHSTCPVQPASNQPKFAPVSLYGAVQYTVIYVSI